MMADWSMLPYDLLGDIALRFDSAQDVIYFSSVCRSWRRSHIMVKKIWTLRMPWLLLAEPTQDHPNHSRNIFCPIKQRCYQLKLPETFGARCWGSSSGWIVTFDLNLEFHLLNPLTRVRLALPPQPTMHDLDPLDIQETRPSWKRQHYIYRVLVFEDNDNDEDLIVIALYGTLPWYVGYARPGDKAWTPLATSEINTSINGNPGKSCVYDVVQRGSQLFLIFCNGALGCCNMSELRGYSQPVKLIEYIPPLTEILDELREGLFKIYLSDSFGDLLMILRYKDEILNENDRRWNRDVVYETLCFEVYRLNFDTKTWDIVNDLGDLALFVGNNSSICVPASSTNNYCKPNCIYFTDDEWQFWHAPTLFGGHDMGVYSMENSRIEKVYEGYDGRSSFCPPLWFMPKFP